MLIDCLRNGKEKEYKTQVEAVEKLLEDFNKYKIIVKEEVIKEIQNLLKKLDIKDCYITIDVIGCQKEIAK